MPEFFDIHSHLNFPDYDGDREQAIARLNEAKIFTITVGTDLETSRSAAELAAKNPGIFATVGLHPNDFAAENFDAKKYAELAGNPKVVAIGECGLDYGRGKGNDESIKKTQREIFEKQIALAIACDKSLMVHCRDAYEDVIKILATHQKSHGEKIRGNIHFFAGSPEIAKKFLNLGFTLSFTGVLTFARDYDEVVRFVPLDMIMSETDAPFVAPAPFRGKRNEPLFVREVANAIVEIKGEPKESVKKALVSNAFRVFGIQSTATPAAS